MNIVKIIVFLISLFIVSDCFTQEKLFELDGRIITSDIFNLNDLSYRKAFKKIYKKDYDQNSDEKKMNALIKDVQKALVADKINEVLLKKNRGKYYESIRETDIFKTKKRNWELKTKEKKQNLMGQVKAYEYLEKNKVSDESIKNAFDLYLKDNKNIDFDAWKKKATDKNVEKLIHSRLKHIEQSEKTWDKLNLSLLIYEFPIWEEAKTNQKVKQYLVEKNQTNKRDDKLEMKILNKWIARELKKEKSFKLYTQKYGNIDEIMDSDNTILLYFL